ncbi:MAG: hypothetical protein ACRCRW_13145 [Aeromonadaceae bacterium]
MRAYRVLAALLLIACVDGMALELKKCWPQCGAELVLPVLKAGPAGTRVSLSLPLTASDLASNAAPDLSPAAMTLPRGSESGLKLKHARPELSWRGDEYKGALRLYGNKVRFKVQSLDQAKQLQFTVKPDEVKLQMQWRFN